MGLLNSIVELIVDYRKGEIPTPDIKHVANWIKQFADKDRAIILAETQRMLEHRYVTQSAMHESVRTLVGRALGGLSSDQRQRVRLLEISKKGNSQKAVSDIAHAIGLREHQLNFRQPPVESTIYLYLDDCLFTGNRLFHDLNNWLSSDPSMVIPDQIKLLFHTVHSSGWNYAFDRLQSVDRLRGKISKFEIDFVCNSRFGTDSYECFWAEQAQSASGELSDLIAKITTARPDAHVYRPAERTSHSELFSSPEARRVVEQAFLEKGAYIIAQCAEPQQSMRPLGFEKLESIGYGAMFVTYRNIANNCPLALWWGDPKSNARGLKCWYPLLPRLINSE